MYRVGGNEFKGSALFTFPAVSHHWMAHHMWRPGPLAQPVSELGKIPTRPITDHRRLFLPLSSSFSCRLFPLTLSPGKQARAAAGAWAKPLLSSILGHIPPMALSQPPPASILPENNQEGSPCFWPFCLPFPAVSVAGVRCQALWFFRASYLGVSGNPPRRWRAGWDLGPVNNRAKEKRCFSNLFFVFSHRPVTTAANTLPNHHYRPSLSPFQ